jgi:hypothetical protein
MLFRNFDFLIRKKYIIRSECYCGQGFGRYGKASEIDCDYKCSGNQSQSCGGLKFNSIWKLNENHNPNKTNSNTKTVYRNSLWFNLANFTLAGYFFFFCIKKRMCFICLNYDFKTIEWSIFYPINQFLTNKNPIRLFDLSDVNMYANADYFQDSQRLELNILFNNNFNKQVIQMNRTMIPIFNMIIIWRNPLFAVYVNCKLAGKVMFNSINDINILSLPYIKPYTISNYGSGLFYNPIRLSLVKANCVDNEFDFPSLVSSFTTTSSYRPISPAPTSPPFINRPNLESAGKSV